MKSRLRGFVAPDETVDVVGFTPHHIWVRKTIVLFGKRFRYGKPIKVQR